jgi:hypothetical protein
MDDCHTCLAPGFKILASNATGHNLGGIALLWKEGHLGYEVESACIVTPNLLTFQIVTGNRYGASLGEALCYINNPTLRLKIEERNVLNECIFVFCIHRNRL